MVEARVERREERLRAEARARERICDVEEVEEDCR